MFFYLSKLIDIALHPLLWVAVLLLLGILRFPTRRGLWLIKGAFYLLIVLSNDFLANTVVRQWEREPMLLSDTPEFDYAVVLGGFTIPEIMPSDRVHLNKAVDRLMHGLLLHRQGKAQKIIISGGSSSLLDNQVKEAESAMRVLNLCSIQPTYVLLDTAARNTRENAINSIELITKDYDSTEHNGRPPRIVVVTSAFHARRAEMTFAKLGQPVVLFATDFRAKKTSYSPVDLFMPSIEAISKWDLLLHEWIGLLSYKLAGYI